MKVRNTEREEKIELQMTPMIDIVFQLLIFFIMSFKIVAVEGDFNIKMPIAAPSPGMPEEPLPPLRVRLTANGEGGVSGIRLDNKVLSNFGELRNEVIAIVGKSGGPSAMENIEVELDCDYGLHYSFVVEAITAVTGYVREGQIEKLVEKVKFARPREEG